MANLGNIVPIQEQTMFWKMVKAARKSGSLHSEDFQNAQCVLIRDTIHYKREVTLEEVKDLVFPEHREFILDGYVDAMLHARGTGEWWNGWAVPAPTYAELADYALQVQKLCDEDEFKKFLVSLLETYGGEDDEEGEATHMVRAWTWSLKQDKNGN